MRKGAVIATLGVFAAVMSLAAADAAPGQAAVSLQQASAAEEGTPAGGIDYAEERKPYVYPEGPPASIRILRTGANPIHMESDYSEGMHFECAATSYPENTYVWYVNGECVLRGKGENRLVITLEPGDLLVELAFVYNGTEHKVGEGRSVVHPLPTVPFENVPCGHEIQFDNRLLDGYGAFVWTVNGAEVSREKVLRYAFPGAGRYEVIGTATNPLNPGPDTPGFVRARYDTYVH